MANNPSLMSAHRKGLYAAHRSRGKSNSNLWLAYSVKTNRDYIFPSDRQFIHWLHYLETNPEVGLFEIEPPPIVSTDAYETRATELDAKVVFKDGHIEWHEIKADDGEIEPGKSQLLAQATAASVQGVTYRMFSDKDLRPHIQTSLRWVKALNYAAVLRDRIFNQETIAVSTLCLSMKAGTIGDVVTALPAFDASLVKGLLVQHAISGHIHLSLKHRSFGSQSPWGITHEMVAE